MSLLLIYWDIAFKYIKGLFLSKEEEKYVIVCESVTPYQKLENIIVDF